MPKTYRNTHDFTIVIGSFYVHPGDTIELVGYNGSMLDPVAAEESATESAPAEPEAPVAEEKPKRTRKAVTEPEAE